MCSGMRIDMESGGVSSSGERESERIRMRGKKTTKTNRHLDSKCFSDWRLTEDMLRPR